MSVFVKDTSAEKHFLIITTYVIRNAAYDHMRHPEIEIVGFSFYNLEVFNQCEHENALLMAAPQWAGVHPLLKILPVEWNHSIPFGLLYSPTPSSAELSPL